MADDDASGDLRFDILATAVGALLLSFLVGSYVTYFELFPFEPYLKQGFVALEAQQEQIRNLWRASDRGKPAGDSDRSRNENMSVFKHVESKTAPGYTMFTTGRGGTGATLVSADGEVVHRWNCK